MFENIKSDYQRVVSEDQASTLTQKIKFILLNYGFFSICVYRFGKYVTTVKIIGIKQLLQIFYYLFKFLTEIMFGIYLDVNSKIGPGFFIGHFGCIIVRGDFGKNCSIAQGVTVGSKGAGKSDGWPTIGDNVYIGAGAKVIGNIKVGNNVRVGANAVVISDTVDNVTMVGVPAKPK